MVQCILLQMFVVRMIFGLNNMFNKTPKGDSVGCFGKGALHWNQW